MLVLLGATAAIVVTALPTTSSVTLPTSPTTDTPGGHSTTTTSRSIISAGLVTECIADVQAVQGAALVFATRNGAEPPAGTSWATASANGGPFLHSWPSAPGQFTVRWTGATVVVVPSHGRAARGSVGTPSPPTGCYAA